MILKDQKELFITSDTDRELRKRRNNKLFNINLITIPSA